MSFAKNVVLCRSDINSPIQQYFLRISKEDPVTTRYVSVRFDRFRSYPGSFSYFLVRYALKASARTHSPIKRQRPFIFSSTDNGARLTFIRFKPFSHFYVNISRFKHVCLAPEMHVKHSAYRPLCYPIFQISVLIRLFSSGLCHLLLFKLGFICCNFSFCFVCFHFILILHRQVHHYF